MAKKPRGKPPKKSTAFRVLWLLLIGAVLVSWWLWTVLYEAPVRLNYLLIEKNGEPLKILKGETLRLSPKDLVRVIKISTNLPFNADIRLVAEGLDASALLYGKMSLAQLLPQRDLLKNYNFMVEVKHQNETLGHFNLLIEPYIEDWLEKADRTIDQTRKIEILLKARELHPEDKRIRDKLISTYRSGKDWKPLSQMLEEMAREQPSAEILGDLLEAYEAMADTEKILTVLRRLIDLKPDDVELRYRLASKLEEAGHRNEAIKAYEDLLNRLKEKERLPVYKILGFLYTETAQPEKAIGVYLKAVKLDPSDVNLYYNLSDLYERAGKSERSRFFLAKAVGLKKEDLEGRLKLAQDLVDEGRFKEAEKYISEILSKDPRSLKALLLAVKIKEKTGDKKGLKELYKTLLSLDPKNETIIYNLGVLEYETGQFEKSRPYFEQLAASQNGDPEIHGFLFDIYQKLGKRKLALKEARILVDLKQKETNLYPFIFDVLNEEGRYQEIINIMNKALKTHPGRTDLRAFLIAAYLKTGREKEAEGHIRQILKVKPKDIEWLSRLARIEEKSGQTEQAFLNYQKILELDPDYKMAREGFIRLELDRAKRLEEEGKLEEALAAFKKILDIAPGQEEAQEAYLRLRLKNLPVGN